MSNAHNRINPLRQRMIQDMTLRKLSPKTQTGHIPLWVKLLAALLKRSPTAAMEKDLRCFPLDLGEGCVRRGSVNPEEASLLVVRR
jgi:hypothetical protein